MTKLTPTEKTDLAKLEARIHRGLGTFLDVGKALWEIHVRQLYRAEHATFEAYCEDRWQFGRAYGYRLIAAAQVAEAVSPVGDIQPTSERQTRPLQGLPPETQREAWAAATEGGHEPTEEEVRKALADLPPEKQRARIEQAEARAGQRMKQDAVKARRKRGASFCERLLGCLEPESYDAGQPLITGLRVLIEDADPERVARVTEAAKVFAKAIGPVVEHKRKGRAA